MAAELSLVMPLVSCVDVAMTYAVGPAVLTAVEGVTVDVYPGNHVAVLGPPGCGKSTLHRLLAGQVAPTAGVVTWPWFDTIPSARPDGVATLPTTPALFPALDVAASLMRPLVLAGMRPDEAQEQAWFALERLDLAAHADTMVGALPAPQQQMVAIAQALAVRARLILADEPTDGLGKADRGPLIANLLSVADDLGAAVVVFTEFPEVAAHLARCWPMHAGRLAVAGNSPNHTT